MTIYGQAGVLETSRKGTFCKEGRFSVTQGRSGSKEDVTSRSGSEGVGQESEPAEEKIRSLGHQ